MGTAIAFLSRLETDFEEMARSVAKYKGFYVSRYEIGIGGSSKKNQTILTSAPSSANMWYGLYSVCRNVTDTTMHSHMIWGSQYDQIVKFAKEKERYDGTGEIFDVFTASIARQKTSYANAGNNLADKVCNIYDLEENCREWTAQANGTDHRLARAGAYGIAGVGNFHPVAGVGTNNNPTSAFSDYSSRTTLYIVP